LSDFTGNIIVADWKYFINDKSVTEEEYNQSVKDHAAWVKEREQKLEVERKADEKASKRKKK
jgi:hypothetical protein